MAKDVIKKKQRIAHNKTNEGHALSSEHGADILSSIIQDMDNNDLLSIMSSNNFDTYISDKRKITSQEKTQSGVNQIPIQNNMTVPRCKKFGLARKGPLMEKSQRTLKLIQHNRKQPKPRAHLAGLSLPFENSASDEMSKAKNMNNLRSTSKFENKVNAKEVCNKKITTKSKITNSVEATESSKISSKKYEIPEMKRYTAKESSHVVENVSKNTKSVLIKTNSCGKKSPHEVRDSEQINNSSDSDEYEKFIRKEKKDLSKSITYNTCNNTKSRKSMKARRKCNSKSMSESDSDMTDEETCKSHRKRKKTRKTNEILDKQYAASKKEKASEKVNKKCISKCDSDTDYNETLACKKKSVVKKLNRSSKTSKTESESEMDVDDVTNHNSSSESDELPSPSEIMYGLQTTNNKNFEQIGNDKLKLSSNSCEDFSNVAVVGNDKSNTIVSEYTSSLKTSDNVTSVNSKQSNIVHNDLCTLPDRDIKPNISFISSSYSVGGAQPNRLQNKSNIPSIDKGNVSLQASVFSNSHPENSKTPLIVDLVESDDECTPLPQIVEVSSLNQSESHSEESDVELVNVIVPPDLQKEVERLQNNNTSNCINSSLLNIKTEKVTSTISSNAQALNTNPNAEPQTSFTKKYEVAYTTGICQKYDEKSISPNNVMEQHNSSNELHSATKDSFILSKVKEEPSDELEVILDTVASDKPSLNLSTQKAVCNRSIKVEQNSEIKQTSSTLNLLSKQAQSNRNMKVQKDLDIKQSSHAINPIGALQSSDLKNVNDLVVSNVKVKKERRDDCETSDKSSISVQTPINKRIKTERDSKAVEQVATAVHTASGPSGNLIEQEQKVHEIQSSTLASLTASQNKIAETVEKATDLHTLNIEALLENLKKEFITYQEILETEESVESTFKMLQKIQADRLKSLKTRIMQCLECVPNADYDSCNSIKKAVDKLLAVPGLSSSTSLKDNQKLPPVSPNQSSSTSNISVQDLKTLANLVPLSTISEEDIKPNVSELQCAIKKEPSSSYESMSFGEKCIVCGKDASSACQRCAKVFFCSNQCGKKYWEEVHINNCVG